MKSYRFRLGVVVLLVAPLFAIKAFAAPEAPKARDAGQAHTDPSLIVFDQRNAGKAVSFSYVYLPFDGYVAVYGSDADGKVAGDALGTCRSLPAITAMSASISEKTSKVE